MMVDSNMDNLGVATKTLLETVSQIDRLNVFLKLIQKADLGELFVEDEVKTVLAPSDQAFANLPGDTIDFWSLAENKQKLIMILKSHILDGELGSHELRNVNELKTISGHVLRINREYGKLMVTEEASVVQADISCSNGIIHVIDNVIIPQI